MVDVNSSVILEKLEFSHGQTTCFQVSVGLFAFFFFLFLLFCVALKKKLKPLLEFDIDRLQATPENNLHVISRPCEHDFNISGRKELETPARISLYYCIVKCVAVIATAVLIMIDMLDIFQDSFMIYYFVKQKENITAFIYLAPTIIPTILSYLLVLCPLLYHVDPSNKRRRLALVLIACSPFLKSCILCWTILMGWRNWKTRWYLQALTFLWLIEAVLEGIPQMILLWYIKHENEDLNINFYYTTDISLVLNFVASTLSLFFATKYLNEDEDRRLEHSKRIVGISHRNRCISFLRKIVYFIALYLERALEIFIRILMFGTFASVVGWKPALYVFTGHAVLFIIFTLFCFRKLKQNHIYYDNCIKKPSFISSLIIGVFANIFFCHSWTFCHIFSRKVVYISYFVLFHLTSISLAVSSNVISGAVDDFSISLYSVILFQLILLSLCFVFRECKRKRLLQK